VNVMKPVSVMLNIGPMIVTVLHVLLETNQQPELSQLTSTALELENVVVMENVLVIKVSEEMHVNVEFVKESQQYVLDTVPVIATETVHVIKDGPTVSQQSKFVIVPLNALQTVLDTENVFVEYVPVMLNTEVSQIALVLMNVQPHVTPAKPANAMELVLVFLVSGVLTANKLPLVLILLTVQLVWLKKIVDGVMMQTSVKTSFFQNHVAMINS